jgi:hypothetical protein
MRFGCRPLKKCSKPTSNTMATLAWVGKLGTNLPFSN